MLTYNTNTLAEVLDRLRDGPLLAVAVRYIRAHSTAINAELSAAVVGLSQHFRSPETPMCYPIFGAMTHNTLTRYCAYLMAARLANLNLCVSMRADVRIIVFRWKQHSTHIAVATRCFRGGCAKRCWPRPRRARTRNK